uniref:Phosphorylated adapter RNA export protein n=1 Tax=Mantoniella antarctica TaxID=81844 RepID=A0A7S0XG11_9CHLO|mmetsp:Transcript_3993/g.9686  ORF Transcript_3993/g.9686 Transcript_3993/m.9686 type:complete len:584 (+) Transcript_3993:218-1969(+)
MAATAEQILLNANDFDDDFSDIDMEDFDSYLTSPLEMMGADGDGAADPARAAARARLAARAAHVDGGMAAQAAAEAAVEAVGLGPHVSENSNAGVHGGSNRRSVFARLGRGTPSQLALDDTTNAGAMKTPGAGPLSAAAKRKHVLSPPGKFVRRKGHTGASINVARAARDLCGDLGEPKESLMRRAIETVGIVVANELAIEVGRIEGQGGQMTSDGLRRRTPGGVFWALLKARASKEDWDFIFEEEKEVQRERCRRRRRAMSLAASGASSLMGSPTFRSFAGTPGASLLRTPAHGLISAAAAAINAVDSDGGGEGSSGAGSQATPAGAAGAPRRPTLAERLNGAATGRGGESGASGGAMASRLRNVQDTPIGTMASAAAAAAGTAATPEISWAARAKIASYATPAAALNIAAYSPTAAAAALTLYSPPAAQHHHRSEGRNADATISSSKAGAWNGDGTMEISEASPGLGVVTPDNDPSAAASAPGGTWAARAKAAAEAEVAASAQVRVRAQAVAAIKLAPVSEATSHAADAAAPGTATAGDAADAMEEDAAMEVGGDEPVAAAAKPASIWAGLASFASMVRAV